MYNINKQDGTIAIVTTWDDDAEFKDMHKAFLLLGFTEKQRNELYTLLSFSMSCGNIEFEENDKSESKVASFDELEKSAGLIEVCALAMGRNHPSLPKYLGPPRGSLACCPAGERGQEEGGEKEGVVRRKVW